MALTAEQRFAQRRLVGMIRSSCWLTHTEGLNLWRGRTDSTFRTSVEDLTDSLDVLEIPYVVAVGELGPYKHNRHVRGFGVRIAWNDLGKVLRWMPSLQKLIDSVEAQDRAGGRPQGPGVHSVDTGPGADHEGRTE